MARKTTPTAAKSATYTPPITEGEALTRGMPEGDHEQVQIPTTEGEDLTTSTPRPNVRGEIVSDLAENYIAASVEYAFLQADRALPQTIDDAEKLYGIDIYDRMKREPILGGIERILKILVLSDGLSIAPSHEQPVAIKTATKPEPDSDQQKANDDWEKADYCARYVRTVIDRLGYMDRPILRTLWNLLDAARLGHKIAEATYDYIEDGEFKGMLGISEFRTKPRLNYAFVVDEMSRFRGIIAKVPGGSIALRTGLVFDVSQIQNAIAPEKLVCLTLDDQDGDPRGVSWWRDLYDPWYRKQLFKPEHLKTGVQFGGGMISIIMPEEKQSQPVDDPSGGQIPGVIGGKVSSMQATLWAGQQLRNGGVGVFGHGTTVNVHKPDANGSFFEQSFAMFDREMVTAFLQTARSILEAKHGSKADSDSAQDLLDELKMYIRTCICELITVRLFRTLIVHSLGPDWIQYCPVATMARTSRPDFPANATAVALLAATVDALGITNNQKEYLKTQVLGLPPSENETDDEEAEANGIGDSTDEDEATGSAAMNKTDPKARAAKAAKPGKDSIDAAYDSAMKRAESKLVKTNNRLTSNKITPDEWVNEFHSELLSGHLDAMVLGAKRAGLKEWKGEEIPKPGYYSLKDWQDKDDKWHQGLESLARGIADTETQYLHGYTDADGKEHRGFLNDLKEHDPRYFDDESGEWREGSLGNRTNLYVGKMRGTANQSFVDSSAELNPDFTFSWELGPKEHCDDCLEYAAILKDRPADEFFAYPGNGDSVCLGNCGCDVERSDGIKGFSNKDDENSDEEK